MIHGVVAEIMTSIENLFCKGWILDEPGPHREDGDRSLGIGENIEQLLAHRMGAGTVKGECHVRDGAAAVGDIGAGRGFREGGAKQGERTAQPRHLEETSPIEVGVAVAHVLIIVRPPSKELT